MALIVSVGANNKRQQGTRAKSIAREMRVHLDDTLLEDGQWAGNGDVEVVVVRQNAESVPNFCFRGCQELSDIMIPCETDLRWIGDGSFENCSSLESLDLRRAHRVRGIGAMAFSGCTNVTGYVYLPADVAQVGESAFLNCSEMNLFYFGLKIKVISKSVLEGCSGLMLVDLPRTVTRIEERAFAGAGHRRDTMNISIFREPLTEIGAHAFVSSFINRVVMNECKNLLELREHTFDDCVRLGYAKLPPLLQRVGDYCFRNTAIKHVNMPNTVSSIGRGAYMGCPRLAYASLSDQITEIPDECFSGCPMLQNADPTERVTRIGHSSYHSCVAIATINIPSAVVAIGDFAFGNCQNLPTITLPRSLAISQLGRETFDKQHIKQVKMMKYGTEITVEDKSWLCMTLPEEDPADMVLFFMSSLGSLQNTFGLDEKGTDTTRYMLVKQMFVDVNFVENRE